MSTSSASPRAAGAAREQTHRSPATHPTACPMFFPLLTALLAASLPLTSASPLRVPSAPERRAVSSTACTGAPAGSLANASNIRLVAHNTTGPDTTPAGTPLVVSDVWQVHGDEGLLLAVRPLTRSHSIYAVARRLNRYMCAAGDVGAVRRRPVPRAPQRRAARVPRERRRRRARVCEHAAARCGARALEARAGAARRDVLCRGASRQPPHI